MSNTLIVGAGRAGLALARAMTAAGSDVRVLARSDAGAARVAERGLRPASALDDRASTWILAVPDDLIAECAATLLAERGAALPDVALHLSGVAAPDALAVLAAQGIATGSLHPLQTLTFASGADVLQGAPAAIGGDARATTAARTLAEALGMQPFTLPDAGRVLYHAAGAMAANFTVALLDRAIATAERAGMPPALAREGLARLATAAAARVLAEGSHAALTGPIRRGDAGTLGRHLAALDTSAPEDAALYRALATPTVALALRAGLEPVQAAQLRRTLVAGT